VVGFFGEIGLEFLCEAVCGLKPGARVTRALFTSDSTDTYYDGKALGASAKAEMSLVRAVVCGQGLPRQSPF
jgi:hypothetical protein